MDSYRAECSGMLSILRFIIRIAEYTATASVWEGTMGTNNQSLLDTIFGRDGEGPVASTPKSLPPRLTPLNPLIPEWDLLVEIRNALTLLPKVRLVYVKAHEDRHRPYNQLSLTSTQTTWPGDTKTNSDGRTQMH
jgi:hypothetical protein